MSQESMNVNMIEAARDAQWDPARFLGPNYLRLIAPAKVNLFLGIGATRADGRHEATTVMQALLLHDTLYLNTKAEPWEMSEDSTLPPWQAIGGPAGNVLVNLDVADKGTPLPLQTAAADNLVFQAVDALCRALGWNSPLQVSIRLEKTIPHQAGLGGGSSDAAAVLVGLAQKLGLAASDARISEVAQALGTDVAFFLKGGAALLDGAGENFVRQLAPLKAPVVLVKPEGGVSTAAAYQAFDQQPDAVPPALLTQVEAAADAADVPLFNNLDAPARQLLPGHRRGGRDAGFSPRRTRASAVRQRRLRVRHRRNPGGRPGPGGRSGQTRLVGSRHQRLPPARLRLGVGAPCHALMR